MGFYFNLMGQNEAYMLGRYQTIIWTNAGIVLIRTSGTNFNEIWSEIHIFTYKKLHLKLSSAKWRSFCFDLNILINLPGDELKLDESNHDKVLSNVFAVHNLVRTH